MVAERKKLHILLDKIPDHCLFSIEPLLAYLADEPIIETNLTDEEKQWIREGREHYRKHPEDFIPLDEVME